MKSRWLCFLRNLFRRGSEPEPVAMESGANQEQEAETVDPAEEFVQWFIAQASVREPREAWAGNLRESTHTRLKVFCKKNGLTARSVQNAAVEYVLDTAGVE